MPSIMSCRPSDRAPLIYFRDSKARTWAGSLHPDKYGPTKTSMGDDNGMNEIETYDEDPSPVKCQLNYGIARKKTVYKFFNELILGITFAAPRRTAQTVYLTALPVINLQLQEM